jgi:hypothetical protein
MQISSIKLMSGLALETAQGHFLGKADLQILI